MNTQEKLLDAALALLLARGYPATTVDEICAAAGVSKGSFYHFFRTKEELGLAVLDEYYRKGVQNLMNGPFQAIEDPKQRLLGFLEHIESVSQQLWSGGCLLGSFALDLAETHPVVRERVSELLSKVARAIAPLFEPLAAQVEDISSEELGEHFLAIIEGSIVLSKAHDNSGNIPRGLRNFRRCVERIVK